MGTCTRAPEGPPSHRTRKAFKRKMADMLLCKSESEELHSRRSVLQTFASDVRRLPPGDGGAIHLLRRGFEFAECGGLEYTSHDAVELVPNVLPRLERAPAHDAHIPGGLSALYAQQGTQRKRGLARPLWQRSKRGRVTLPHLDLDIRKKRIGTYVVCAAGEEVIVAWRDVDLSEAAILEDLPSLRGLHDVPSLTVMHCVTGDVIYIPPGVVHMVVTTVDKVHLAFHCYEM